MLDIAAIHPDLHAGDSSAPHFRACRDARDELKRSLDALLGLDGFDLYLLPSTSAALATLLYCACLSGLGCALSGPPSQHYPPFLGLFGEGGGAGLTFRTHVSPVTGAVDALPPGAKLVDGAQSLGTCLTQELLRGSDIALAPLHKHLGLAVGLALVLVRRSSAKAEGFGRTLAIVEAGAQPLALLAGARDRLAAADGRIFNKATFTVDADLETQVARLGLRLLGTSGPPFACLTTRDGSPVTGRLNPGPWRHMAATNAARFAFDRRGRRDDPPVDCTRALLQSLRAVLR